MRIQRDRIRQFHALHHGRLVTKDERLTQETVDKHNMAFGHNAFAVWGLFIRCQDCKEHPEHGGTYVIRNSNPGAVF